MTDQKSLPLIEQAKLWYQKNGISAYTFNGELFIKVGKYEIQVHQEEIQYRANLYKNNIISTN